MWDLSSPTRDGTHIPYLARWILNRWTTKEVLRMTFKLIRGLELWHEEDLDLNPASTAFCGGGRDRGLCDLEHGSLGFFICRAVIGNRNMHFQVCVVRIK